MSRLLCLWARRENPAISADTPEPEILLLLSPSPFFALGKQLCNQLICFVNKRTWFLNRASSWRSNRHVTGTFLVYFMYEHITIASPLPVPAFSLYKKGFFDRKLESECEKKGANCRHWNMFTQLGKNFLPKKVNGFPQRVQGGEVKPINRKNIRAPSVCDLSSSSTNLRQCDRGTKVHFQSGFVLPEV